MTEGTPIPLIIYGGSDGRAGRLPPEAQGFHALAGYKAARIQIAGRPLVLRVIERMQASGYFDPIYLAGPEKIYRAVGVATPIIETDSSFGNNIRAGIAGVRRHYPEGPMAMMTCDVLPEPEELQRIMEEYRRCLPCDFFYPLVRIPEEPEGLGASGWKPRYRLRPEPGAEPAALLPGHLAIVVPEVHRLQFLYKLIDAGYATRNRSIAGRRWTMVRRTLGAIMAEEVAVAARMQVPDLSYAAWKYGLGTARKLAAGEATQADLETALAWLFFSPEHRKAAGVGRLRVPLVDAISLAQDIDTEEEAAEKDALPEMDFPGEEAV